MNKSDIDLKDKVGSLFWVLNFDLRKLIFLSFIFLKENINFLKCYFPPLYYKGAFINIYLIVKERYKIIQIN